MEFEIIKLQITENETDGEKRRLLFELLVLSREWAEERCSPGYDANEESEYYEKEIYIALSDGRAVGYLMGHIKTLEEKTSYNDVGEACFELDELFVTKAFRGRGIARTLFRFVENDVRHRVDVIGLVAAAHDYKPLLKFYVDELDMRFNHALLVKRMEKFKGE